MSILYAGIDLAKNVFALHGVDVAGRVALRKLIEQLRDFAGHHSPIATKPLPFGGCVRRRNFILFRCGRRFLA